MSAIIVSKILIVVLLISIILIGALFATIEVFAFPSSIVPKYYENNPTATYKQFISRNKSSGLIEVVREGDPAIVVFQGSYKYGNTTTSLEKDSSHAVICIGYSQKKFGLIHSVDEYSVFSGWNNRNKGELLITKSVILNNYSFKVLS